MTVMLSEEDQERYLDRGLKKIKAQSFHIHTAIEKNNLRQCLKETYSMLSELRTSALTPKNYYHLFTTIFDEMQIVENFFSEEISRGRKVRDLYDSVQQAVYLIPRLYLMITAGSLVMENEPKSSSEIIFDLLGMVKGVQNPIRGLFVRYYLLKRIKDKLPDKDNVYLKEGGNFDDTLRFIIQNMDEMNRLWIRLGSDVLGNEKILRDKERVELKILVGESINRLSSLDGLTLELYEKEVLPKLIQIIIESNDILSQQYLMECIIHAFSDSYNIKCIELILNTLSRLTPGVDIKGLFISLMEKLAKFITDNSGEDATEEDKKLVSNATSVYPVLAQYFDRLQKETLMLGDNMDILKLLDLNTSFMKFSIKCTDNDVLASINHILTSTLGCLRQLTRRLSNDGIKKLSRLLAVPLESDHSLFEMTDFDGLILFLDYNMRKNLGLKIVHSLYKSNSKEKLDSVEKIQKLLKLIRPLIADVEDAQEEDNYTFESEQNEVSKMIFVVNSQDPEVIYEIYGELKNVFVNGGVNRRKMTLPPLANCIIAFCHKLSLAYDNKNGLISEEIKKSSYVTENINSIDISKIDSDETFYKLMLNVYKLLNEVITLVSQDNPEDALKLYLASASQVNSIQSDRNNFEEACASFMNAAMNLYQEGKYDQNLKFSLLSQIVGYILSFTILGNENVENIIKILMESGTKMVKRGDQFNSMLSIGEIYYLVIKDGNKVNEYITKARKYADFAMTNPQNLILFVELLNKFLYYVENGDELITIKPEQIDEIIELIRNHIQTIKNEVSVDSSFLPNIEKYFDNTIEIIKKRKNEENHKPIYDSILNN
jgi:vacuolar protein sorting-associated protein 35